MISLPRNVLTSAFVALCLVQLAACAGAGAPRNSSSGLITNLPEEIARQELVLRHVEEQSEATRNHAASAPRLLDGMKALLQAVEGYEQRAEELKLVELMRCVREKRNAVAELVSVSQGALDKLQTRAKIGDDETAEYEYSRIAVASQRSRGVVVEIASCTEHDQPHTGPTEVEVEVDGTVE